MVVSKTVSFDAAHYLPGYKGKCKKMHGHHWKVEVAVEGVMLKSTGMVMDFTWLKKMLNTEVVKKYDHTCLNDVGFINPTAENIALEIYSKIRNEWILGPDNPIQLKWVKVWESEGSYVMIDDPEEV